MSLTERFLKVGPDARGQAVTEFAIVMPVVLLMFFGALQYLVIFRTSQHVNYAAFVAARSYAVNGSIDGNLKAQRKAYDAAALALAPVARPAPGEFLGIGSLTGGGPRFLALFEGFLVARYVRLDPKLGGGSLKIRKTKEAPVEVEVEINYPQPIFIPGLAEVWSLTGGGKDLGIDLASLDEGLSGPISIPDQIRDAVPAELEEILPGISQRAENFVRSQLQRIMYPYVNVRGKCSMGYSDWGRKDGKAYKKYRPRLARTVTDVKSEDPGRDFDAEADQLDKDSEEVKSLANNELDACADMRAAQDQLRDAEANYRNTPDNPPEAKQQAGDQLNAAREDDASARQRYADLRRELNSTFNQLEKQAGKRYETSPCNP